MKIRGCLILLMSLNSVCFAQTRVTLTSNEESNSKLFTLLLKHIKERLAEKSISIIDSSSESKETQKTNDSLVLIAKEKDSNDINYLLSNFFLVANMRGDSLTKKQIFEIAKREINELYYSFSVININHIRFEPLRLYSDKYIYSKMSQFQQENTFVFFDVNASSKPLGYILFIPAKSLKSTSPKILSWKITFSFGQFFFEDIIGQEGIEYFFEGVKGPEYPIDIKNEL